MVAALQGFGVSHEGRGVAAMEAAFVDYEVSRLTLRLIFVGEKSIGAWTT